MSKAIEGLKPAGVWKAFADLSAIPRPSKHEAAAAAFVIDTAKRLGLEWAQDAAGSVVVRKPASKGYEGRPMVCLQGHLDMVPEKRPDKQHDFLKDPITLVRKGNVMMADGTTLGADNGVAVATSLAIMADTSLAHGPLEFLFTVDEETGLTGANNLQPGFLKSTILLNLDSEEEGELYVGCSGGRDTMGTWALDTEPAPAGTVGLLVKVGGLRGGHSGLEIDKGRGNAIKILNRALMKLAPAGARLASIDGGNKRNAIPRDASALVFVPKPKAAEAKAIVAAVNDVCRAELASVEPSLAVTAEPFKGRRKVVRKGLQKKLTMALAALPHGVIKMSADIPGLVETSTNVGVITTGKKDISVATSQRSSVASEIAEIADAVRAVFELGGAKVSGSDGYPGWKPNLESPILKLAIATYKKLYGKEPAVKAVHAGLECGIIGEKYPGMDMVSFGPTLEGVHSPDEKIHIDTVQKYWDFLLALLQNVT
ncbi:MAG TPA: aminoacyl-histidine dipeptidase [Vicinamibacterales bacterium]|nr:aminoacyl-histidine dipeptidase [Vicinamibacterales bacterium]HPK72037.1 aminoacyl-histidine dipeptidase [Vicinamibacterales bacterium]